MANLGEYLSKSPAWPLTPVLYEFSGSCWAQVPKLAIEELGLQDQVEYKSVNLAEVGVCGCGVSGKAGWMSSAGDGWGRHRRCDATAIA